MNKKQRKEKKTKGITLIALILTVIILLILAVVTINRIGGEEGIIARAKETKILAAIANIKEEIKLQKIEGMLEEKEITIESLFAEGKIRRKVEAQTIDTEESFYIYYAIKDGAFSGMNGLGKGADTDVFLIDDNLNISYIDPKGKEYGDEISRKLLEDDTQIRFASPAFGAYVSKIGGASEEKMLFKWMKTQTSLTISDANIDNLEDLVFFPNLTSITIANVSNNLANLTGIENCKKLTSVYMTAKPTNFKDFSALKSLPNLTNYESYNGVNKEVWNNLIDTLKEVSTLKSFTIRRFQTWENEDDVNRIGELTSLETLTLNQSEIKKIPDLKNMKNLTTLGLYGNQIPKIEGIENLTNLTDISLGGNKITKVEGLEKLVNLKSLYLHYNQMTDISGIKNNKELTSLDLSNNQITDISELSNITNLKTLNLSNNKIVEVLPLANCNQLTSLNLKGNATIRTNNYTEEEKTQLLEIAKIITVRKGTISVDKEQLTLFNGYKSLDLSNQNLTDLKLLEGQTELTSLNLSNNQITLEDKESQEILKKMTKLQGLNLSNNNLKDISAINSLKNLTALTLDGNTVDLTQIEDIISTLRLVINKQDTIDTLLNCTPNKITKLNFYPNSLRGCRLPDLSKFTSLEKLDLGNCGLITGYENVSKLKSLKTLSLASCGLHDKGMIDLSNLTNLTSLYLSGNSLWTEDLEGLMCLKNNENLTIALNNNSIIDPEILLELPSHFKIDLRNNINISEGFKTRAREHFGKNVTF